MVVQLGAPARARFVGAQLVPIAKDRVRVRVRLEFPKGAYVGQAEGGTALDDELRTAAAATLAAIRQAVGEKEVVFELKEVAGFDAFGKPGVMVSVTVEHQTQARSLLGFAPLADEPLRAAAVAVLSATNRFLAIR
jgi:proteasome assembly chaperone (PAC2) family protein